MKYPYDIVSYVRTNKTFSVEARFDSEKEESPLKVFNSFSRYVLTAISDKKAATCNLHVEDLPELIKLTDYAFNKHMESTSASNTSGDSPAFTVRFATGKLKGKTPIEVMLENPENGKQILNDQYTWLKNNLDKYPGNKTIMDAIVDASKVDMSTVDAAPANTSVITLLDLGCRPLVRKLNESGEAFCYECKIIWDTSKKYPVSCMIKNYYAPFVKKDNGLINVSAGKKNKDTEVTNEVSMTSAEWLNVVECMKMARDSFYMCNFNSAYKLANDSDKQNRENAKIAAS